jgi:NitT/TauT family transport system substrate-binding protein
LPLATTVATAQDLTTVSAIMPLPRSANFYPLIAGEALGYFEDEGIEVNLLPSETSVPYVAFVQNGQADLAMLDGPQTFQAAAAGIPFKVVYEAMQRAPEGVAVLADSAYQDVSELKGKTIGLVSDRDRQTFAIALDARGLSIDDVTTVVVGEGGPTLANALRTESVAAIAGAVPDWLAVQASGIGIRLITPEEVAVSPANSYVASAERLDEMRPVLEGFFRAWSKGMEVAKIDPDALAAMAKAAVPEEWENETFGREFLDASIPMNYSITEQLGQPQPDVWEQIQDPMVKVGLIEEKIDPSTFLDDSLIGPANDFDREQVRKDVEAWKAENM